MSASGRKPPDVPEAGHAVVAKTHACARPEPRRCEPKRAATNPALTQRRGAESRITHALGRTGRKSAEIWVLSCWSRANSPIRPANYDSSSTWPFSRYSILGTYVARKDSQVFDVKGMFERARTDSNRRPPGSKLDEEISRIYYSRIIRNLRSHRRRDIVAFVTTAHNEAALRHAKLPHEFGRRYPRPHVECGRLAPQVTRRHLPVARCVGGASCPPATNQNSPAYSATIRPSHRARRQAE